MDPQEAREEIVTEYIERTKCSVKEAESFDAVVKQSLRIEDKEPPMYIADFFLLGDVPMGDI